MKNNSKNDRSKIERIIIVGGGSSGWITATYLLKALDFNVDIQVIESPTIGRIGVGEATIPTIKEELFDFLGIPEEVWMPKCNATYKMGIRFVNWKTPAAEGGDYYYHSFGEIPLVDKIPLSHIWLEKHLQGDKSRFDFSCYSTARLCEEFKSPKDLGQNKAVHCAYHFDAKLVAEFLQKWALDRGVTHIADDIVHTELDEDGSIKTLLGLKGETYSADLYIDCSGFSGVLIDKALKEPWISYSNSLLTDRAVAVNIPENVDEIESIRPYTTATALNSGWVWEIPLFGRSGNGYVYSSQFATANDAEQELRDYFGPKSDNLKFKHIKFQSGRRRNCWVKNCISMGLAGNFLEPLESTGLYFVYASLYQLAQYFPGKKIDPVLRAKYNERVAYMVEDVKEFIIIHFCTSPREDTAFWRANKHDLNIPDSLKNMLALQKAGIPLNKSYHGNESLYSTFDASFDRFWTNSNFQSIFAGVEYLPETGLPLLKHRRKTMAKGEALIHEIDSETRRLLDELPTHLEYLKFLNSEPYHAVKDAYMDKMKLSQE